jgi:hypothetical protein
LGALHGRGQFDRRGRRKRGSPVPATISASTASSEGRRGGRRSFAPHFRTPNSSETDLGARAAKRSTSNVQLSTFKGVRGDAGFFCHCPARGAGGMLLRNCDLDRVGGHEPCRMASPPFWRTLGVRRLRDGRRCSAPRCRTLKQDFDDGCSTVRFEDEDEDEDDRARDALRSESVAMRAGGRGTSPPKARRRSPDSRPPPAPARQARGHESC